MKTFKTVLSFAAVSLCLSTVSGPALALENLYPVFSRELQKALSEQGSSLKADQFVYSAPESYYEPALNAPANCNGTLNIQICAKQQAWDRLATSALIATPSPTLSSNASVAPASEDTYVFVVPGIFGEFIEQPAFGEVFGRPSQFQAEWNQKLIKNRTILDSQELLARVNPKNPTGAADVPLRDLFKVGSVDRNGAAQFRVAVFQTTPMSLETLGDSAARAAIFNRRLEKFFQVIGHIPKNIIFVGYSRGTTFGLDMLAQAKAQNKPWLQSVRAMVGLGGVVFGSTLADDAIYNVNSLNYKQIALIRVLLANLKPFPAGANIFQKTQIDFNNRKARLAFIGGMIRLHAQAGDLSLSNLSFTNVQDLVPKASPTAVVEMALVLAQKYGVTAGMLYPMSDETSNGILRFQRLVNATITGVSQLASPFRMEWWKSHSVPLNVRYLAISGLIDSPESKFFSLSKGFDTRSSDDKMLYKNWSDFAKVNFVETKHNIRFSGTHMNDSQVDVVSSQFWPDVIGSLNAANRGIQAGSLGLLATHHWGLALPYVNKLVINKQTITNGAPREAILKAIVSTALSR